MSPRSPLKLRYRHPAEEAITEGLPLGNGRLGVLVCGGLPSERLVLNEGTLWSGGPYDQSSPDALAALPEVRRLIFAGELRAAAELTQAKLMARPMTQAPYQPLGDLFLDFRGHFFEDTLTRGVFQQAHHRLDVRVELYFFGIHLSLGCGDGRQMGEEAEVTQGGEGAGAASGLEE